MHHLGNKSKRAMQNCHIPRWTYQFLHPVVRRPRSDFHPKGTSVSASSICRGVLWVNYSQMVRLRYELINGFQSVVVQSMSVCAVKGVLGCTERRYCLILTTVTPEGNCSAWVERTHFCDVSMSVPLNRATLKLHLHPSIHTWNDEERAPHCSSSVAKPEAVHLWILPSRYCKSCSFVLVHSENFIFHQEYVGTAVCYW